MKHFEDIWTEAEGLQEKKEYRDRLNEIEQLIRDCIELPEQRNDERFMSELMFLMAGLSKDLNINVAAALKSAVDDKKIDTYG